MDLEELKEGQHTEEEEDEQKEVETELTVEHTEEETEEKTEEAEQIKTEDKKAQPSVQIEVKEADKKKKRGLIVKCVITGIVLAALLFLLFQQVGKIKQGNESAASDMPNIEQESVPDNRKGLQAETVTQEPLHESETSELTNPTIAADSVYSSYAILVRVKDQAVLLDKNGSEKIYPASMTKIMTALVAIEQLPDLEEKITLTSEQINPLYEEGASMAGFNAGESVSVRDLLYGVMLPSGADACVALAERIAGSEQGFVELMNQKAQELGMANTHFVTDSGLHDDNHYSTCADLAVLLNYALKNDTFRMIFSSHDYVCEPTEYHPEGLYLASTLFGKMESDTLENGAVIEGGKTGFTDEAQLCLASVAKIQGEEYILVTAYAQGNHHTEPYHILDACAVYAQIGA